MACSPPKWTTGDSILSDVVRGENEVSAAYRLAQQLQREPSMSRGNAVLRTAIIMSVVVGTLLVSINHADHLWRAETCSYCYAKCGLCYVVPFLVSLVSAVLVSRRARRRRRNG